MDNGRNYFDNTRAALVEFDAGKPEREAMWQPKALKTLADCAKAEAAEKKALEKVQLAFYQDTKHINCLDNCRRVDIGFMRQCVTNAGERP